MGWQDSELFEVSHLIRQNNMHKAHRLAAEGFSHDHYIASILST
ncbi:hypothetical protein IWX88_000278 [Frigoribacterium sp. CG_9.8]|nr:hypothetical protein [Frigoribacterium sp. CG_9.8]